MPLILLRQNETFDITMAGGSLRKDGGIIGEATVNFISQFRLDFGIWALVQLILMVHYWIMIITKSKLNELL